MKFCSKCGLQNQDDVLFCLNCGTKFETVGTVSENQSNIQAQEINPQYQPQTPVQPQQQFQQPQQYPQVQQQPVQTQQYQQQPQYQQYQPYQPQQQMGYYNQPPISVPGKGMAITSLVFGILSLTVYFSFMGIIGIILGAIGKKKIRSVGASTGVATAGFILSLIGTIIFGIIIMIVVIAVVVAMNY